MVYVPIRKKRGTDIGNSNFNFCGKFLTVVSGNSVIVIVIQYYFIAVLKLQ